MARIISRNGRNGNSSSKCGDFWRDVKTKSSFREHPNFEKIIAATLKNLLNSLSFVSFAVQSYQVLGSFLPLEQNKFTHLGCSQVYQRLNREELIDFAENILQLIYQYQPKKLANMIDNYLAQLPGGEDWFE